MKHLTFRAGLAAVLLLTILMGAALGVSPAEEKVPVEVTVELSAPLETDTVFILYLADRQGDTDYSRIAVVKGKAGQSQLRADFKIQRGERFLAGYCDFNYVKDESGAMLIDWTPGPAANARYAAETGITSQTELAKVYEAGADSRITVEEPACISLSGALTRQGDYLCEQAWYVLAEFEDGETYGYRVVFADGEANGQYEIRIPQSQQGKSFQLSAAQACWHGMGSQVQRRSQMVSGSYTLDDPIQADFIIPEETPNVWGTVSLPEGITAPAGGVDIQVCVSENYGSITNVLPYTLCHIDEGERSCTYQLSTLYAPVEGCYEISAELITPVDGVYWGASGSFEETNQVDLVFPEQVVISGTITVPEACRAGEATVLLQLESDMYYTSDIVVIPSGETEGSYSFELLKGTRLGGLSMTVLEDSSDQLTGVNLYLQPDLEHFSQVQSALDSVLEQDLQLETQLTAQPSEPAQPGVVLSGTIRLEEGAPDGRYAGYVYLEPVEGGESYSGWFDFTGSCGTYSISLPQEVSGSCYIWLFASTAPEGVYRASYYYSEAGIVTQRRLATPVELGSQGQIPDLSIPKSTILSGKLVDADGSPVCWDEEETLSLQLLPAEGWEYGSDIISCDAVVDEHGNWYVVLEPTLTGSYHLCTDSYFGYPANIVARNYYYSAAKETVYEEAQALPLELGQEDLTGLELYVDTGWILSGTLKLPAGGYLAGDSQALTVMAQCQENGKTISYHDDIYLQWNGGDYFIVVDKQARVYSIAVKRANHTSTNTYTNLDFNTVEITRNVGMVSGNQFGLDITLAREGFFLTGNIYSPPYLDEQVVLELQAWTVDKSHLLDAQVVTVGPGVGTQTSDGEWFSRYALRSDSLNPGDSYLLTLTLKEGGGYQNIGPCYVYVDGGISTRWQEDGGTHTVPDSGPTTLNLGHLEWDAGSDYWRLESEHGFIHNTGAVYTYTYPGQAEGLKVTFSPYTDWGLTINGVEYTAAELTEKPLEVEGTSLTIELNEPPSLAVFGFGFAVTRVDPVGGSALSSYAIAAVNSASGSTGEALLKELKAGEPVKVYIEGPSLGYGIGEYYSLLGAVYDQQGMMLDVVDVQVFLNGGKYVSLQFDGDTGQAETLKLFLLDGGLDPEMQQLTYTAS